MRFPLYSKDRKILLRAPYTDEVVKVSEGTEIIAQGAFYDRRLMETVVLPNSLKTICRDAFSRCSMLDDVILPEGTEMIGWEAFCLCSNLKRITLPRSMKKVESGAFKMCDNLKEIVYPKGMKMENGRDAVLRKISYFLFAISAFYCIFVPCILIKTKHAGTGTSDNID